MRLVVQRATPTRYQAVDWTIDPTPLYSVQGVIYLAPQRWEIPALREEAMVYRDSIRLSRSIRLADDNGALRSALDSAEKLAINGSLRVQACDESTSYAARRIPLPWQFRLPAAGDMHHH
jgi:hypothetical protein